MTTQELLREIRDRLERHWSLDTIAHQLHVPLTVIEHLVKKT